MSGIENASEKIMAILDFLRELDEETVVQWIRDNFINYVHTGIQDKPKAKEERKEPRKHKRGSYKKRKRWHLTKVQKENISRGRIEYFKKKKEVAQIKPEEKAVF